MTLLISCFQLLAYTLVQNSKPSYCHDFYTSSNSDRFSLANQQ